MRETAAKRPGGKAAAQAPSETTELQALANPLRMRAYVLLRVEGGKTTGDIAETVGCAVGSMSYHLHQLEAAQLVKRVAAPDGDGRKSWWVAREGGERPELAASTDRAGHEAIEAFRSARGVVYGEMYRRYLAQCDTMEKAWREGEVAADAFMRLTPDELKQLSSEMDELLSRWDKVASGHVEGDGSEQVALVFQGFKWVP